MAEMRRAWRTLGWAVPSVLCLFEKPAVVDARSVSVGIATPAGGLVPAGQTASARHCSVVRLSIGGGNIQLWTADNSGGALCVEAL